MPTPSSAERQTTATVWRRAASDLRQRAWPLLLVSIAARVLVFAAFSPLAAVVLHLGLWLSGESVVTDLGILAVASSPIGLVAIAAAAIIGLTGWAFELLAMVWLLRHPKSDAWSALWAALAHTAVAARVVGRVLAEATRWLAPTLAVVGAAYLLLLRDYDINYYLSQRPPAFVAALAVAAVALSVAAWGVAGVLARWLTTPAMVADGTDYANIVQADVKKDIENDRARKFLLAQWIAASFALPALLAAIGAAAFAILTPWWPRSLVAIATGFGLCVLVGWLTGLACSFLSNAALAALISALTETSNDGADGHGFRSAAWLTRRRAAIGAAVLIAASSLAGFAALSRVTAGGDVDVIAHRGAALVAPENTLASVEAAIEAGADWVEIDVQETKDGEVIVVHDSDFMKSAGVATKVWEVTTSELAEVDIGSRVAPEFAGERVPTLRQVLDACRDRVGLLIELKYYGHDVDLERRVAERVEAAGMAEQTRYMSLEREGVRKLKALRPSWDVGLLLSVYLGRSKDLDADFLAMNAAFISPQSARRATREGRELYAWTVNDPVQMASLATSGVSGLITDDPVLARKTLAEWRDLSPVGRLLLHFAGRVTPGSTTAEQ